MIKLILINLVCIIMDIVLICLEYTNKYVGEASIKPMIYAIKLKLEFTILNQLMSMTKAGLTEGNRRRGGPNPELLNQGFCKNSSPQAKFGTWGTIRAAYAPVKPRPDRIIQNQNETYKTQQIQVFTEAGNPSYPSLSPEPGSPSCTALIKDNAK